MSFNNQLDNAIRTSNMQPIIRELVTVSCARSLEIGQGKQLSLSEFIVYAVEGGKMVENAHFFSTLHTFLLSVEGQQLLHTWEEVLASGVKGLPVMLVLFYTLREVVYGLQENAELPTLEIA